jgi:hypothetical protein
MIRILPGLRQHIRSEVAVVADTATSHVITLLASTLSARNPLITAPPMHSIIWDRAGDMKAAGELMETYNRAIVDPFFLRAGAEGGDVPKDRGSLNPWLIATANLGIQSLFSFPRVYLNTLQPLRDALKALQDEAAVTLSSLPLDGSTLETLVEKDALRVPFAKVALALAYENIVRSGVFDKIPKPEAQGEGRQYVMSERALLLSAMLRMLAVQTVLLRVRPLLRYLRTEQSRARLRMSMVPANVEFFENMMDRILAIPVHPWIALAEETTLPANRITPWGNTTPTVLLERGFLASPWDGRKPATSADLAAYATSMNEKLDPQVMLERIKGLILQLRQYFDDLEDQGRFSKMASLFNFTTPRGPVNIPMYGDAYQPLYMDGLNADQAVQNIIAATFQLHLPAQGPKGSPWIGAKKIDTFYGADRADGSSNMWSENWGSVAIAPEDVVLDQAFALSKLTPAAFRFKDQDYKGDLDAMFVPATVEGIAPLVGLSALELTNEVRDHAGKWKHIFTVDGDKVAPTRPNGLVFYSERTRSTWLTTIDLPRRGVPTVMWAMVRGRAETAMPTMTEVVRDTTIPAPTVPMNSAIDGLVAQTTPSPLTGIRG